MCGFIGAFGPSAKKYSQNIHRALEAIQHRGPDSQGVYISTDEMCIIGHVRLSIIDTSTAAKQPFYDGPNVLAFNGEIYNHLDLRAQYGLSGCRTHSDTETFCKLLTHSVDPHIIFKNINGMYAGAYYKESRKSLYLFRDPLGIKPLYIYEAPDSTLIFGSEIKAILALCPDLEVSWNQETLAFYLKYANWPQSHSFFNKIKLCEPGTWLNAKVKNLTQIVFEKTVTSVSELMVNEEFSKVEDWVAYTEYHLKKSVKAHLLSDVPLGANLSGGIDSGLISYFASKHLNNLYTFTGFFEGDDFYDESPLASAIAEKCGAKHYKIPIKPNHFIDHFDQLIWHLEEPRMGMGAFSQLIVAKEARKHRKVLLAGHGGDELFAGYQAFRAFFFYENFPQTKALRALKAIRRMDFIWLVYLGLNMFRGKVTYAPTLYPNASKHSWPSLSSDKGVFYDTSFRPQTDNLFRYYLQTYLPGLLVVEDKVSMSQSLETRLPLWSLPIIKSALSIPLEEKLKNGVLKNLLRGVADKYLPPSVLSAPKKGFPTPLRHWFRNELYDFIHSRLTSYNSEIYRFVSKAELNQLLLSHKKGEGQPYAIDERRAQKIWLLLNLDAWCRLFGNSPLLPKKPVLDSGSEILKK